jgi:hypothetical protein
MRMHACTLVLVCVLLNTYAFARTSRGCSEQFDSYAYCVIVLASAAIVRRFDVTAALSEKDAALCALQRPQKNCSAHMQMSCSQAISITLSTLHSFSCRSQCIMCVNAVKQ